MGACKSKINSNKQSKSIALNEATISDIQTKIKNRLMSHKNQSEVSVKSGSSIKIRDNSSDTIKNSNFFKSTTSEKKGPFGIFGKKKNCLLFGCPYTAIQSSTIRLHTYNSSIRDEKDNILNEIETNLKQQAETQLSQSSASAANRAFDGIKETIRADIEEKLENLTNFSIDDQQEVDIEYTTPVRCRDPCGLDGGPYGPVIRQNSMFSIHAENIINNVIEKYTESLREHNIKVVQKISDENKECILQLAISAICCFTCLIFVWKMLQMKQQNMQRMYR